MLIPKHALSVEKLVDAESAANSPDRHYFPAHRLFVPFRPWPLWLFILTRLSLLFLPPS